MSRLLVVLAALAEPSLVSAGGVPLLDAAGASHGAAVVSLSRGFVQLKIAGLAPLPAVVTTGSGTFTAVNYKSYAYSSADPAVEIFLTDVYPNARQRAARRVTLGGDVSRMGLDRIVVTAFSSDGQASFDVLTATLR